MNSIINLEAGNKIEYTVKNARMIEIYTNTPNVEEETTDNKITKLIIANKTFQIGDKFQHDLEKIPSKYAISKIERGVSTKTLYNHCYTLFSHLRNKTSTYILPCLMTEKKYDRNYFMTDSYFVNAYLNEKPEDAAELILLYRFATSENYALLENNILHHPQFRKINNSIEGFDAFTMEIPEAYLKDLVLYGRGKYSNLSGNLKDKIKTFYNLNPKSRTLQILNRDKELVTELEKEFRCNFNGVDLEQKPKENEEVWQ